MLDWIKPMMDFVNNNPAMFEVGWNNPVLNWKPVIESNCSGNHERYLIEDPIPQCQKAIFINTLRNETQRKYFNDDFAKYAPMFFLYERDTPKSREISAAFRTFYLQDKPLEYPQSLISI
ncbi:hypothetical protein DOY81_012493 [Sarcophaga bullata]|nr:hypothetical protein DOY81_012493 [Sarcophaga bullata]